MENAGTGSVVISPSNSERVKCTGKRCKSMDVKFDEIDGEAWDAFVARSTNAHFMQSYAWGELQRQAGWGVHRIAVVDQENIQAAAQLLSRAVPLTGQRIFYAPRGPVLTCANGDAPNLLSSAMRSCMARARGAFLRADPYRREGDEADTALKAMGFEKVPRDWSYWNAPRFVFWLDLRGGEEALLKAMPGNTRREIRNGYAKAVEYSHGGFDDLDDFHRLLVSMSQHKGIAVHDLDYYRRLYSTLAASCKTQLFLARYEGKVIGVGMSVAFGSTAWLLYAASDSNYFKLGINRNVQWEMIRWALDLGCTRYDFRGTATGDPPSESDPGYGVYRFKKSFGPEFTRLAGYYDLVGSRSVYRIARFGEEKVLPSAYRAKVWLDERRGGSSKS